MVEEAARYAAEARDVVRACKRAGTYKAMFSLKKNEILIGLYFAAPPSLKQLPKTSQDDGKLTPPNGTPRREASGPAISKGKNRRETYFIEGLSSYRQGLLVRWMSFAIVSQGADRQFPAGLRPALEALLLPK